MFGLEDQKNKKKQPEFIYELEKEMKDAAKSKEIRERIEKRLQILTSTLRAGSTKEEIDELGKILFGYQSLLKVFAKIMDKKK